MSNLQLNTLKSGIKDGTEILLKIRSNVIGDSNDENNLPHKLPQVSKPGKDFSNSPSANIKLSNIKLHKIGQSGGLQTLKTITTTRLKNIF